MLVKEFIIDSSLKRCDTINYDIYLSTYYDDSLGHASCIDYILVSDIENVLAFTVLVPDINLSDHRPIIVDYHCNDSVFNDIYSCRGSFVKSKASDCIPQLRWDNANLDMYRKLTEASLRPIYDKLISD